jgi:ubiquinone biosynthesis protein Coq4
MRQPYSLYRPRMALLTWLIIHAVPLLNRFRPRTAWPYPLASLRRFPPHSWGLAVAHFLAARGFTAYLPNYEAHDAFHVLLDYETDVHGEVRLQAFMVGNRSASFAGRVLFFLSIALLPELWTAMRQAYRRGRHSAQVGRWDVPTLLDQDLATLRQQLAPATS